MLAVLCPDSFVRRQLQNGSQIIGNGVGDNHLALLGVSSDFAHIGRRKLRTLLGIVGQNILGVRVLLAGGDNLTEIHAVLLGGGDIVLVDNHSAGAAGVDGVLSGSGGHRNGASHRNHAGDNDGSDLLYDYLGRLQLFLDLLGEFHGHIFDRVQMIHQFHLFYLDSGI